MGLLVRALLTWLLVLAVPAQGAAAATMAFCGPHHHERAVAGVVLGAAVSQHAHHGDSAPAQESHADASATTAASDDVRSGVKIGQTAKQKCSACASCCSMGAMLANAPAVPASLSVPTVFATVTPTVDAFAADGPDRPPRNVLA